MTITRYHVDSESMEVWDKLMLEKFEEMLIMASEQLENTKEEDPYHSEVFEYYQGVNDMYWAFLHIMDKKYNFVKEEIKQ